MFKPVQNIFIVLSIGLLSLALAGDAHAARYALLIGNDSYQGVPALRNARADADAMGLALQKAGYNVTVMKDRNLKQMKDDVREFKAHIKGGDEVVFFYSGHGVQIEAMNYLLPVDVRAESEDQVRDDALALSQVLSDLRDQKPALTLAVIDACRDNPFKGTGRAIGGRGLTGVGGANGQMVIYSAGEGQQALDRLSESDPVKNGLFTRVLMKEMEKPGAPIDQVARQVRAEVNRMAQTVKHEQVPAIYDQVIGQYYFYAQQAGNVDDVEIIFWQSIKDSSDPAELKAYLEKYPDGQFAGLAQARVKRLELGQASPAIKPVAEASKAVAKEDAPAIAPEKTVPEAESATSATAPTANTAATAAVIEVPATVEVPAKAEVVPAPMNTSDNGEAETSQPATNPAEHTGPASPEIPPATAPQVNTPMAQPVVDAQAVVSETPIEPFVEGHSASTDTLPPASPALSAPVNAAHTEAVPAQAESPTASPAAAENGQGPVTELQ